ncbi:protein TolQ [Haliangium ochraceum]|uniref:Protein TolQ n=1 Tax=Haliangium ochraceum (strain DSM 14365 / JCM 11303 / SMP-2) TaxID=502025 RepID=D0LGN1_HALO1|nr:protein TolQ [Haliangium ochraceum]ACY12777.1 protein TolQ [Haliangium ochraceum DSM 14365]
MLDFLHILAAAGQLDLASLILQAHWVVKAVMALLALMSIIGWYIIGSKHIHIRRATKESNKFLESFWRTRDIEQIYKQAKGLQNSPISAMFLAGYTELAKLEADERPTRDKEADLENVERALRRTQTIETTKLENMIPFLATTGSAAPFIGLFGTVWGIMNSFTSLGSGAANIQTVAPGIAEALFATAIGLVAAIPAVMAYNYFTRRIRIQVSHMNTFEQDYLNIIRRHFLS